VPLHDLCFGVLVTSTPFALLAMYICSGPDADKLKRSGNGGQVARTSSFVQERTSLMPGVSSRSRYRMASWRYSCQCQQGLCVLVTSTPFALLAMYIARGPTPTN
jgi:hypothetical protein